MKCQKCSKPAVVHLTEIIGDTGGGKRAVEIHLCLSHAADAGLIAPGTDILPHLVAPESGKAMVSPDTGLPTAIVPAAAASQPLALRGKEPGTETTACPLCGLTWSSFKAAGLLGCPHDYELFESRLAPLLKRAQEGAVEHVGKIPQESEISGGGSALGVGALRRELQRALDAENYEQAASLRDQLRHLEEN